MRTNAHFDGVADSLAIHKRTEARVRVSDSAMTSGENELGMLARDHGPLVLRKEVMTSRGISSHENFLVGKGTLTLELTAAILCKN